MEPKIEVYCGTAPDNAAVTNVTLIRNGEIIHGTVPTRQLESWLNTAANFKTGVGAERATGTRG